MCYTVSQLQEKVEKAAVRINVKASAQLQIDFHAVSGFTHPNLLVITGEKPLSLSLSRWGLVPSWCRSEEKAAELENYTLNAKSETVFEKPSFRSVVRNRCLLPVNGFFEWREHKKKKYPYFIIPSEAEVFMLGCLYDTWTNEQTGEILKTFSIITTPANALMARIHNTKKRMPLIIPEGKELEWMDTGRTKEGITDMMRPYQEERMKAYSVSKRITSRTDNPNVPEVIEPFNYPELQDAG